MGKAAFIAATRHARQHVVMASTDRITFDEPVRVGDLIECVASIARVGRFIDDGGRRPHPRGCAERTPPGAAVRGTFEMVAVDANGRPDADFRLPGSQRSSRGSRHVKHHKVRTYKSAERLDRADQLAWKIAAVARRPGAGRGRSRRDDRQPHHRQTAAVAAASIARHPVITRAGTGSSASAGAGRDDLWGCRAASVISRNGRRGPMASPSRELDFHDTFLAADYSHPGDKHSSGAGGRAALRMFGRRSRARAGSGL